MTTVWSRCFLIIGILFCSWSFAEEVPTPTKPLTAHETVTAVTEDMISVINGNKALLASDANAYYDKVAALLEPVVAFDYISKIVMSKHYATATESQREAFATTFKAAMVETFAKGMANYSDLAINMMPSESKTDGQRKVEVLQEVKTKDGTHVVSYTMAQTKTGDWKLINVVLNGINLGSTFKDQFAQSMRQNNNDVDKAIADWGKKSS